MVIKEEFDPVPVSVAKIAAAEANLRALMDEMALLRELVRLNPNYSGDWRDHPQYRATRKAFRIATATGSDLMKRKHRNKRKERNG